MLRTALPARRQAVGLALLRRGESSAVPQLCHVRATAPPLARSFFKLPDLSGLSPFATPAQSGAPGQEPSGTETFREHVELPFTAQQLHALVHDVDAYSQFLPYCSHSRVTGAGTSEPQDPPGADVRLAELGVGFKGFNESYTSRVLSVPGKRVEATATSSPIFKYLRTVWEFEPAPSSQPEAPRTTIDFSLRYAFANPLLAAVARASCERMAREMIGAFEKRAAVVYGQPRQQAR